MNPESPSGSITPIVPDFDSRSTEPSAVLVAITPTAVSWCAAGLREKIDHSLAPFFGLDREGRAVG
jgi:hypothetical protein